jgi:MFS family permease
MFAAPFKRISRLFQPSIPVSGPARSLIFHLYMDMLWMGVLNGTIGAFLTVYAARLGAPDTQVGLLNAAPAVMNLIFALPAGSWMIQRRLSKVSFWSAALGRIFYLPFILLPYFFSSQAQVWVLIILTLVMSIPLTVLNVSFNAMFAEQLPLEARGFVASGRNALLAVFTLLFTLGAGRLLTVLPFPLGYQIVFGLGFLGGMFSTLHLYWIRNVSQPKMMETITAKQPKIGFLEQLRSLDRHYLRVVMLLFFFHIAQWLVIPVNPLLAVHKLKLTDFQISLGSALFSLVNFVVSFQVARFINWTGNRKAAGYGMIGLAMYPFLLSLAREEKMYIIANLVGGIAWSVLAVALINYLLEFVPEENRTRYVSYYILASNGSILIGSLAGPYIASMVGYSEALAIFAVLRALSGVAVLLWG